MIHRTSFLIAVFTILLFSFTQAQTPAFPGAEGFARYTTSGGRGGTVYHVTNLNDSGTGSFREGLKSGNRIIVFDISGTIILSSELKVSKDNTTIAGQTAPGDGITLRKFPLMISANNVIVRFIRCRLGNEATLEYISANPSTAKKAPADDAFGGKQKSNIIIDHCTASWSVDECCSFYDNTNFTMQWCLISESLSDAGHPKGAHGYGGIWGGKGASFHHNLLANHTSRNPRFCGSRYSNQPNLELIDMRNNVISNWGNTNSGYAGEGGNYNFINNYYKYGKATKTSIRSRIFQPNADDGTNSQALGVWGKFYVIGNYVYGFPDVTADNWLGINPNPNPVQLADIDKIKSTTAFDIKPTTTHTAEIAYQKVLAYAGASLKRDTVDKRIIKQIETDTYLYGTNGIIDTPEQVGGWPELKSLPTPADSNNDGIPNEWAAKHLPLEKAYNHIEPTSGYSYLEIYINSLVEDIMKAGYTDATETSISANDYPSLTTDIEK